MHVSLWASSRFLWIVSACGPSLPLSTPHADAGMLQCTETFEVGPVDVGGAYVGGTQDRILRVADELGIETYPVHKAGKNIVEVCCCRCSHQ